MEASVNGHSPTQKAGNFFACPAAVGSPFRALPRRLEEGDSCLISLGVAFTEKGCLVVMPMRELVCPIICCFLISYLKSFDILHFLLLARSFALSCFSR